MPKEEEEDCPFLEQIQNGWGHTISLVSRQLGDEEAEQIANALMDPVNKVEYLNDLSNDYIEFSGAMAMAEALVEETNQETMMMKQRLDIDSKNTIIGRKEDTIVVDSTTFGVNKVPWRLPTRRRLSKRRTRDHHHCNHLHHR